MSLMETSNYDEDLSEELLEELEAAKEEVGCSDGQVLYLNYCGLQVVPEKLFREAHNYQKLTRIYMKRNKLKSLPDEIADLKNLVELYIPDNEISEIPESISKLEKLESLDLSSNHLTTLPGSICRLQALEKLNVSCNQITQIPKDISNLHNLKVLEAMNNKLRHLPQEVSRLENLVRLLVDRNELYWLPLQLCKLQKLEELSAAGNKLLCLPLDLGEMHSLRCVYVDNNPYLHAVPVSVYSQELGFSSCGSENFVADPHRPALQYLDIKHTEELTKKIYLPRELKTQGRRERATVESLLELSLREVYLHWRNVLTATDLPVQLQYMLSTPVSKCVCCQRPIFTMGYPMVFEGQVRIYDIYKLTLCCSPRCVKVASLVVNLPLVYPASGDLCMAVVLVPN